MSSRLPSAARTPCQRDATIKSGSDLDPGGVFSPFAEIRRRKLRVLEQVRSALDDSRVPHEMHVYSQGRREDFVAFERRGDTVHLDDDPFAAFHNLVCADVLIMARSSFSYTAALLRKGVKIYEPFWHKPLSEWIPVGAGGSFDTARLSRMIGGPG